ncbi:MAG TPA: N(4)-(beta-N-acetylglucosaminyl)-L-asparaginase [Vicinamibacterales bacterium]|nr:N(4)-(beta-N-acetylglucosaminyl)-L-asparaginase [Vicinamibacterales bacterium]
MSPRMTRRDFVKTGAAAGMLTAGPASAQGPVVIASKASRPVVIASANGNVHKNGGARTAVHEAYERIMRGDDVLDALVAGVNICELDPADDSVGYGGLPNADGVVQLDASCMHGPLKRAGAVAALEGVRTPANVAQAVLDQTDHHLIVGKGAQDFARSLGFKIEDDLNSENSRKQWLEWKRRIDSEHWLDPGKRAEESWRVTREMMAEGRIDTEHVYGTINCNGINAKGDICGVTTTSGLAWKIPGRVGDSPILGAGLYVDGDVGAAGSTGRGEANLYNLSSFLIVENLRRGMHPKDAGMDALRRVKANTVEKRLLNSRGEPKFYVKFYIVDRQGRYAGVGMYARQNGVDQKFALCTEKGPESLPLEGLLGEAAPE